MKTEIDFNQGQKFHHQVQTSFQYIRWQLGSRIGEKVGGSFCSSSRGRKQYAPNGSFSRATSRAYTNTTAADVRGASSSATSGCSKSVNIRYQSRRNNQAHHYLCTPNVGVSK